MTELTERAVTERVPGLIDEKLKVLSPRDPVTVRPGTSLQTCLELIRETGAGVVADPDDVAALKAALVELHARWAAGTLNGTPLALEDRERLGRGARIEELADVLRGLA